MDTVVVTLTEPEWSVTSRVTGPDRIWLRGRGSLAGRAWVWMQGGDIGGPRELKQLACCGRV